MFLKAIELHEVGTFLEPVRFGGLVAGCNVLAGPNELGKSTLLRALTALFLESHRSTKKELRALRPYQGGAPRITCEFDLGGHVWRLEKQFLSAQKAILERDDGRERFQGADAENRVDELFAAHGHVRDSLPLLWVGQGAGFEVPRPEGGIRSTLDRLLTDEVETTSGVGRAQGVLKQVDAELGEFFTPTGLLKKGGTYQKLRAEYDELTQALAAAKERAGDAETRLERLAALQNEEGQLVDAELNQALKAAIAGDEARLAAARQARRQLDQIIERIAALEEQKAYRAAALADWDAGLETLAKGAEWIGAAEAELHGLVEHIGWRSAERERIRAALETQETQQHQLRSELDAVAQAAEKRLQRERLGVITTQFRRLEKLQQDAADVDARLSEMDWPERTIDALRRAIATRDQLEARRASRVPRMRVAYADGVAAGFSSEGRPLSDGEDIGVVGKALRIEAAGIGHIEIVAGEGDAAVSLEEELAAACTNVDRILGVIGVDDIEAAETRESERQALLQQRALLQAERQAIAPDGLEGLAAEIERLEARVGPSSNEVDTGPTASPESIRAALQEAIDKATVLRRELDTLTAETSRSQQRQTELETELRLRRAERETLRVRYGAGDACKRGRDDLVGQLTAGEQALNAATRERLALQEVTKSDEELDVAQKGLVARKRELEHRRERLNEVRREISLTEGMLSRDFESGVGEELGALSGRTEEAANRLGELEAHIAALRLLASELRAETEQQRSTLAAPLAVRLATLAARLWPKAAFTVTPDLGVAGLERAGQAEDGNAVSAGTREQMAVLARLAYGGLIAEGVQPLPVILDDPLVFSDDERLAALFAVIADAARTHQIIVLTCHARAFEPLITEHGAERLVISRPQV